MSKPAQDAKISKRPRPTERPEKEHSASSIHSTGKILYTLPLIVGLLACNVGLNHQSLLITTGKYLPLWSSHLKLQWPFQDLLPTAEILRHLLPCPACPPDGGFSNLCAGSYNLQLSTNTLSLHPCKTTNECYCV